MVGWDKNLFWGRGFGVALLLAAITVRSLLHAEGSGQGVVHRQPVLPLLPGGARAIGASAGLAEGPDGGVVFVFGLATFVYAAGDETGRRLAAVQLVTSRVAAAGEVAAAFGGQRGARCGAGVRTSPGTGWAGWSGSGPAAGPDAAHPGADRADHRPARAGVVAAGGRRGDRGVHRDGAGGAGPGRPPPAGRPATTADDLGDLSRPWAARRARNASQGADAWPLRHR